VRDHLAPFRAALEGRATRQEWFELQQAQLAYHPKMAGPKIVWPHFQSKPSFCLDTDGYFLNNKAYFIPNLPLFELAFLNSNVGWFLLYSLARIKRGGFIEAEAQYVEQLPSLCDAGVAERDRLTALANTAASRTAERDKAVADVCRRIPDLCPAGRDPKLSTALKFWWRLDFSTFRSAVKKAFKQDIPLVDRNDWENYLKSEGDRIRSLNAEIDHAEHEINEIIYKIFNLTPEEVALLVN